MISILAAIALFSFTASPLEAVIPEPFELRVARVESRINKTRHGVSARARAREPRERSHDAVVVGWATL